MPGKTFRAERKRFVFDPRRVATSDFTRMYQDGWKVIGNEKQTLPDKSKIITLIIERWRRV